MFPQDVSLCGSIKGFSPYRPTAGRPDRPGDSFPTLVSPARVEGCPLRDRPKRGRKPPHPPALAQSPTSPPARPRIIGPRLFWRSCVPAFLKDCLKDWGAGRGTMFSLTARIGQPMGKSQTPRAARPLLFSPVRGETRGTRVRSTSGNRVSPSQGAVRPTSGYRFSPSQGAVGRPLERDREGLARRRRGLFWLSCVLVFLKGWGSRPGNDVLPHREDRSTDGEIADAPRRKTPLVLPCGGERRGGPGFAQPPGTGSLPLKGPCA